MKLRGGLFILTLSALFFSCIKSNNIVGDGDIIGGGGPATFTLNATGGNCSNATVQGTYTVGTALDATNKVTIEVNVTVTGSYSISGSGGGMSFSKSGSFTTTGVQTVVLAGTGNPTTAGANTIAFSGGGTSCNFVVTVVPPAPPAVFTLTGSPGACTPGTVNGSYFATAPLGASNTVDIKVDVTSAGAYTITTNTVNGMVFSKSGVFAATGAGQTVTLVGSGTPIAAGTSTMTPQVGTSSCTFDVIVGAAPPGILSAKIDGVLTTFYVNAAATYVIPGTFISIDGDNATGSPVSLSLAINQSLGSLGNITTGTYVNTQAALISGYMVTADYTDASNAGWGPAPAIVGTPDPFTIVVTSITATKIIGTFSGTLRDGPGTGTTTKTVTEGVFNVPIQ